MKTAILLATWNGREWIEKLICSLQALSDPDFTVLYQDDGSTDGTLQLLENIRDVRFQPGKEQGKHLGPAGNFFSLMRQADADLYLPCDQDDVWRADKLTVMKKTVAALEEEAPGLPLLVHSDAVLINGRDEIIGESFFTRQGWDSEAVGLKQLLVQNNVTGCCLMMNRPLRDLVIQYGKPEKMFMHDWFIAQTAAAFGKIRFVAQPLVQYRQHEENAVGASRKGMLARGIAALRVPEKARERILLTYRQAEVLRDAFGDRLPQASREIVENYLKTENMPRSARIRTVLREGYRMQGLVPRLGQIIFG